jgi:hypothetical protein
LRALQRVVFDRYLPNHVIAQTSPGQLSAIALLEDRTAVGGRPTAYVCRNFTCDEPVTEAAQLAAQLSLPLVV